ncbi:MAG: ISKra4 family transposase [Terriglobales bacterium]
MIAYEREFLKAHKGLGELIEKVRQAGTDGRRLDEVERVVFTDLMAMGFHLINAFVTAAGNGDVGETVDVPAVCEVPTAEQPMATRTLRRLPEPHSRSYVSIFGKLEITRYVYGTREGQKIEAVPLDARLGVPEGGFSYVLEDWQQRLCIKESFEEATGDLAEMLGVAPSVRAAEVMNRHMAESAPFFRREQPLPPADEEGEILVFTADGKGVPMRRPAEEKRPHGQRRTKGQKANKKKMSYVGATYSINRFVRTADDVVDELARKETARDRPQPQHKRVIAEMTQVVEGEECNGRVTLFGELSDEVRSRNPGNRKPVVAVMDGERALWDVLTFFLPCAIGILDLFHVMERLWLAAHVFHAEGSTAAQDFVTDRLWMLLEGRVGGVIGGLRQMLAKHSLPAAKRRTLQTVIGYFSNNRNHMKYDEYLAAGYPIGSGVAEGACRHLVKDRMEQTGMRWTVDGAQALLHLRAIYINGDWPAFVTYRIQKEQDRLYPYKTMVAV